MFIYVNTFKGLKKGKSALSLFVDDKTGGILDDLILTKTEQDYLYMVTNAGCREQDMKMLTKQLVGQNFNSVYFRFSILHLFYF